MSFWGALLGVLWAILKDVLPLVVEWIQRRNTDPLKKARQRALDLQKQRAYTAQLLREQKGEDLTANQNFKLMLLDQLFRERKLRRKEH